jgi:hypothetical protein
LPLQNHTSAIAIAIATWYCYYCCHYATPTRQCFSARCAEHEAASRRHGLGSPCFRRRHAAVRRGIMLVISFCSPAHTPIRSPRPYACWLALLARSYTAAPRHHGTARPIENPTDHLPLPFQPPASISRRASTASTTPFAPMPRSTWPRLCSSASSSTAPS